MADEAKNTAPTATRGLNFQMLFAAFNPPAAPLPPNNTYIASPIPKTIPNEEKIILIESLWFEIILKKEKINFITHPPAFAHKFPRHPP